MTEPVLGKLEKVELRKAWALEDKNFTPWLAQETNIALLGETLGLDLEVERTEKPVGPFNADILCRDTLRDNWVLIENQLELTDHRHLGQIITYAAGLDAMTIVWVAAKFTDEHRAAIDWLNEITSERFTFFGLETELWRIGESQPAPKFNVVSAPNAWSKSVAHAARSGDLSEKAKFFTDYWESFLRGSEEHCELMRGKPPAKDAWLGFKLAQNFFLTATIRRKLTVLRVALEIGGNESVACFGQLQEKQDIIETQAGLPLIWQERQGSQWKYVYIDKSGIDASKKDQWSQQHAWLLDNILLFERVFRPQIESLDPSSWTPPEESE